MEELKGFFGENGTGSITYDQFNEALTKSGMKLVDINKGGYVDKGKYDRLDGEYKKFKSENNIEEAMKKYADYDQIKEELSGYKAREEEAKLLKEVKDAGIDDKFARFVLSEVKAKATAENKDFKKCLEAYAKENVQFRSQSQKVFTMGSSAPIGDKEAESKGINEKMNEMFRGFRK